MFTSFEVLADFGFKTLEDEVTGKIGGLASSMVGVKLMFRPSSSSSAQEAALSQKEEAAAVREAAAAVVVVAAPVE